MLLQAHDYWWLHTNRGCELQVGGSDQWGNILQGVDLIRRRAGATVHALSWPLLLASDGSKLGKTTGARTWLDPAKTSPYQLYQHFIQTDDGDVARDLRWLTLVPVDEIDAVVDRHLQAPQRREAQRTLAREVVTIVHGPDEARAAEAASQVLFGAPLAEIDPTTMATVAAEVPSTELDLGTGIDLVDLLAQTGLASSKSEATRVVKQGGAYVNNEKWAAGGVVGPDQLLHGRYVLLRRGKDQYHLVVGGPRG
jgi:tyrosyl-tRNA synthetase